MKTRAEKIEDFLGDLSTEIDIVYHVDCEEVEDWNDVFQQVEVGGGLDVEIIYYSRAIEYLSENDPSLNESLGIASEYGYTTDILNSELLASLLASRDVRDEFYELEDEITEFFNELEDDEDEE